MMIARRTRIPAKNRYHLRDPFRKMLNPEKKKPLRGFGLRRISEQSAGESVSALTVDRHSAMHIVTANCI